MNYIKYKLKNQSRRIFQKKIWQGLKYTLGGCLWIKATGITQALAQNMTDSNKINIQQSLEIAQKNIQDKQKKVLSNEVIPDERAGFGQISLEQSIIKLIQSKIPPIPSKLIDLSKTSSTISDGRRAGIIIQTTLPDVTKIAILFDKNPNMMTGVYQFAKGTLPYLEIPIKMRESGNIYVLVQSQNQWFMQKKSAQVLLGGCG